MWYKLFLVKRFLEDLLIFPFVWAGRRRSHLFIPNKNYDVFLFFPFYHTGGAEKIHCQIARALHGYRALIIFTRKSTDAHFLLSFQQSGHDIVDASKLTDNKYRYWKNLYYRGLFSGYINRQPGKVVVFNGQSNFAYKLSRWIRKDIPQVELIHSYSSFSWIRIPFISFFRQTVMISENRIKDHIAQYRKLRVPEHYESRIIHIPNAIELPSQKLKRKFNPGQLSMMFVGRGTSEKRVQLAVAIAKEAKRQSLPVSMSYVGDLQQVLSAEKHQLDKIYGNVEDPNILATLYREHADILLITSSAEGLPLVMLEAMAFGSIIMATPVGDIPLYMKAADSGLLFSTVDDEKRIIGEAIQYLKMLLSNPELCSRTSEQNQQYAYAHFGLPDFNKRYIELIQSLLL